MNEDVFVVGAGPAGISSAYYLEKAGISYRVVDKAHEIASTWAHLYPSLRLNTAGFVSHLPGKRIPLKYDLYPLGRDYYQYILDYMREHDFNIDLGVTVKSVTPEGDLWRVETDEGVSHHPCVIIASGRFGNPYLPPILGADEFEGTYIHSNDFHDPADFAGQRVIVVGNGPSGVDIALALVETAQTPVTLAIRSDIVVARQYTYGLPNTAWHLIARLLPKAWRQPFINRVNYQTYPGVEKLGLPLAPNRDDRVGTSAPVRGKGFVEAVRDGLIKPAAGLAHLERDAAILMDGTRQPTDAVIMCTGYRPVLDYLDIPFETDREGWMLREAEDSQAVKGYPGLFLVGRFYRGLGPLHNIREEAQIAVREIGAHLRRSPADPPTRRAQSTESV